MLLAPFLFAAVSKVFFDRVTSRDCSEMIGRGSRSYLPYQTLFQTTYLVHISKFEPSKWCVPCLLLISQAEATSNKNVLLPYSTYRAKGVYLPVMKDAAVGLLQINADVAHSDQHAIYARTNAMGA